MKTTIIRKAVCAVGFTVAVAVGLTACGASLDRDDSVQDLIDSGLSAEAAGCTFDAMLVELGEDKMTSEDELSPEDQATIVKIIADCMAG